MDGFGGCVDEKAERRGEKQPLRSEVGALGEVSAEAKLSALSRGNRGVPMNPPKERVSAIGLFGCVPNLFDRSCNF